MCSLGAMMTCYDEVDAVKYSIEQFRIYYPDAKIYLVTESNIDYKTIFKNDSNILIEQSEDTMGFYCNNSSLHVTYKDIDNQIKIKKAAIAFLNRVYKAINFSKNEYLLLMDPDVLIRGKLTIPSNVYLLGSRTNKNVPESVKEFMKSINGAIEINAWGATPGIFSTKMFIKAYNNFFSNPLFLEQFCLRWPAFYAHDIIIPTIFALIGIPEVYNEDFTECNTDFDWTVNKKPLVHHFKKYYPNAKEKFPWWKE